MLTLDNVFRASRVLKKVIRQTDMIYAPNISKEAKVYLKTENLQVTGSFKIRGSFYKMSQLTDEEKANGVIACSAGNHAQGVALAATQKVLSVYQMVHLFLKLKQLRDMGQRYVW